MEKLIVCIGGLNDAEFYTSRESLLSALNKTADLEYGNTVMDWYDSLDQGQDAASRMYVIANGEYYDTWVWAY